MKWNSVRWGVEYFCTGPTRAAKAVQKSLVTAWRAQRTNLRQYPFHMYSLSPQLPQFQQSAVATTLWFTPPATHTLPHLPPHEMVGLWRHLHWSSSFSSSIIGLQGCDNWLGIQVYVGQEWSAKIIANSVFVIGRGWICPESIEWFIEAQAFLRSDDSAPHPPSFPPYPVSCISFSVYMCVAVELTDGRGVRGWARSQIIRPQESLAICIIHYSLDMSKDFKNKLRLARIICIAKVQNICGTSVKMLMSHLWTITVTETFAVTTWSWVHDLTYNLGVEQTQIFDRAVISIPKPTCI